MIFGIGTDLVDVRRIEKALKTFGARFETRLFTPYEQSLSHKQSNTALYYGKRFAAKEAFVKALGTGIGMAVFWKDVEVRNNALGKPFFAIGVQFTRIFKADFTSPAEDSSGSEFDG